MARLIGKVLAGAVVGVALLAGVGAGWGAEGAAAAGQQVPTVGLLEAASTGNLAMVKLHIAVGNKIDLVGDNGMTALDYAAKNDDIKMYQVLMETGLFKPTSNLKFLAAHKLAKVDEILKKEVPEALQLVQVEGDDVKLLEKPKLAPAPADARAAMARIKQLAGQLSGLPEGEKEKLLSRVEELWKLRAARVPRRAEMDESRAATQGRPMYTPRPEAGVQWMDTGQAERLIWVAGDANPIVKEYLTEYRENPFMLDLLKIAARVAVQMEGEKK